MVTEPVTPGGGGDGCSAEFALCELTPTRCCSGLDCVVDEEFGTRCRAPCTAPDQCEAQECVAVEVTDTRYCGYSGVGDAPLPSGECLSAGEDCDERSPCCRSLICVTADGSDIDGCRPLCTADDECDSGCCQRAQGRANGFCAPARYCRCGEATAACGGFEPDCCEGFSCTTDEGQTASCKPQCETEADCASGCCVEISGTGQRVCVAADRCN